MKEKEKGNYNSRSFEANSFVLKARFYLSEILQITQAMLMVKATSTPPVISYYGIV
jgi:hypothetical protein